MKRFVTTVRSVAAVFGVLGVYTAGCASASSENVGTLGGSQEELTAESLSHARVLPVLRDGEVPKAVLRAAANPIQTAAGAKLTYRGGPLLGTVKVYTVFWGSNIANQAALGQFYSDVLNSPYMDWLSEYNVNGKTIGRGTFAGAYVIPQAPSSITDPQISAKLDALIAAGTLPKPDANTLFMNYFPPGTSISLDTSKSCVQFCAYHSTATLSTGGNFYYGVMPDQGGSCAGGCGRGSQLDNTKVTSSHELIEAVTDPAVGLNILSWYDDAQGEIGDICNGQAGTVNGQAIQLEWSNKNNKCIATDGTVTPPPPPPPPPRPPPGPPPPPPPPPPPRPAPPPRPRPRSTPGPRRPRRPSTPGPRPRRPSTPGPRPRRLRPAATTPRSSRTIASRTRTISDRASRARSAPVTAICRPGRSQARSPTT
jgi:hypothetical protein